MKIQPFNFLHATTRNTHTHTHTHTPGWGLGPSATSHVYHEDHFPLLKKRFSEEALCPNAYKLKKRNLHTLSPSLSLYLSLSLSVLPLHSMQHGRASPSFLNALRREDTWGTWVPPCPIIPESCHLVALTEVESASLRRWPRCLSHERAAQCSALPHRVSLSSLWCCMRCTVDSTKQTKINSQNIDKL